MTMAAFVLSSTATSLMLRMTARHTVSYCSAGRFSNHIANRYNYSGICSFRQRFSAAAAATDTAQPGDNVEVHYTGTLDSGEVFDSSKGRKPLSFTIGAGQVIKGFDVAVTGLSVGATRKQRIEPQDAYGEKTDKLIARLPKDRCPPGLEVGAMVELANGMPAVITDVTDTEVEIDANHRLSGQALTFDVELVRLTKA